MCVRVCVCVCVCVCVRKRESPAFRGEGGLGQVEEAQSFVQAAHLLDQVGDSWHKGFIRTDSSKLIKKIK